MGSLKAGSASSHFQVLILAFSIVVTVIYAPFAIAAVLAERLQDTLPLSFVLAATFFSIGLGTILSAKLTGTGLAVAPAVGMAIFISQISDRTLSTWQLLLVTMFAGIVATFLARPSSDGKSFTQKLLEELPKPVKVGVRGGIGTLLVTSAHEALTHGTQLKPEITTHVVYAFVLSVVLLLVSEIWFRSNKSIRQKGQLNALAYLETHVSVAAYVVIPIAFLVFLYWRGAFPAPQWQSQIQLPASFFDLPIFVVKSTDAELLPQGLTMLSFFILILFVLLTDIPGSPYDILQRLAKEKSDKPEFEKAIQKSFRVTAIMTMLNPCVGLFTSVYYAENHVAVKDQDAAEGSTIGATPSIAWIVASVFLAIGVSFLFLAIPLTDMRQWLWVAVAPSLFCLGVHITARALLLDLKEELSDKEREEPTFSFFVPVALTIILTHVVGFELALPIGIIYFAIASGVPYGEWKEKFGQNFVVIFYAAAFVGCVLGWVKLDDYAKGHSKERAKIEHSRAQPAVSNPNKH